jgi:alkanesulfonate monooxygenase SsuD/methylene tetrahydromethanopterin reductase-like flavin-dependent oxidoreductase (luciferase family)
MVGAARTAERLGFESVWLFDHFHRWPHPDDSIVFEAFTGLTGVAALTSRIRLGHLVLCAGYRNPALVAKMLSTLDAISRGRVEVGIGAGWYEDEWRAFGYAFPERSVRLATLRDHLEILGRMFGPGRATFNGAHAQVAGAVNEPKPVQDPLPIMVGGNGPNVTWRLAAKYAHELNLDGLSPARVSQALPVIARRCEEIGRDPASLRVSVHVFPDGLGARGQERVDRLGAYAELGVSRLMTPVPGLVRSDDVLHALAADAGAAGLGLDAASEDVGGG